MSGFKEGYFDNGKIRLHYAEAGEGPLVIFYHGFPLFWFSFHHQMTALQEKYRVVAVDGLGINLSSKPEDLSLYKLENLAALLDLHLLGVALLGGGRVGGRGGLRWRCGHGDQPGRAASLRPAARRGRPPAGTARAAPNRTRKTPPSLFH